MAWSTPSTHSTGTVLNSSLMNLELNDNMDLTLPALSTAAGQLFYASGANTPVALDPPGTNNSLLFYNSTAVAPVWVQDMTAEAVITGQAASTSGSEPSTSTYTTYSKGTVTLPTGWNTAKVLAWGSVYVGSTGFGGDTNAVLNVRVQIGGTFSTHRPSNAMTTSENDTHAHNTFSTTIAANSTIAVQGNFSGSTVGQAVFKASEISWLAIRKS